MKILSKYILLTSSIIFLIFITSCGNRKIITIDKDIRKIDVVNHKGYMVKSYYEKYSNDYSDWLKAKCYKEVNVEILKCKFTSSSLILINNSKNDNEIQIVSNNSDNNNQQESQEEDNQDQENNDDNEEEGFFDFGCNENCE